VSSDIPSAAGPFIGPRLKLERAWNHIESLATRVYEYGIEAKVEFGPYDASNGCRRVFFTPPPPSDLACVVGDAAHNLRSALDILVCDVARMRGKSTKSVRFPFGTDPIHFEARMKDAGLAKVDPMMADLVRSLQPFPTGNKALRDLHDLDIQDKHELLLPVFFKSAAMVQPGGYMAYGMAQMFNQLVNAEGVPDGRSVGAMKTTVQNGIHGTEVEIDGVVNFIPMLGPVPHEATVRHGQDVPMGGGGDPNQFMTLVTGFLPLMFPDSDFPFARQPVLETLQEAADSVSKIISLFEDKFNII
jgi:hypothetical protein